MPGLLKPNKRKQAMTMKNNNTSLTLKNSVLTVIAQQRLFLTGLGIVILAGTLAALLPPLVLEQIVNQLTLRQAVGVGPALAYFLFLALAGILESLQTVMIPARDRKLPGRSARTSAPSSILCRRLILHGRTRGKLFLCSSTTSTR